MQYYARMVCELNNEATLGSIIAMNEALSHPEPEEFFAKILTPTIIISPVPMILSRAGNH